MTSAVHTVVKALRLVLLLLHPQRHYLFTLSRSQLFAESHTAEPSLRVGGTPVQMSSFSSTGIHNSRLDILGNSLKLLDPEA